MDIGFKSSTICILQEGELVLSRVVGIGGDKITGGLAENMAISYAEAEGIKMGMPAEVQPILEALVAPLGRELRAMGYRKLTARPRHHGQKTDDIADFKKHSQPAWQKSGRPFPEARR